MLDKGSFEKLFLSKLENYDLTIVDITYLETVNYSRDNFENISKLLDYLKTLELEEVVFSPKINNEQYHIRITGFEGLKSNLSIYWSNEKKAVDIVEATGLGYMYKDGVKYFDVRRMVQRSTGFMPHYFNPRTGNYGFIPERDDAEDDVM